MRRRHILAGVLLSLVAPPLAAKAQQKAGKVWRTIFIAAERGTPARSRFRTAVRRKSWGIRCGTSAALQAVSQARR